MTVLCLPICPSVSHPHLPRTLPSAHYSSDLHNKLSSSRSSTDIPTKQQSNTPPPQLPDAVLNPSTCLFGWWLQYWIIAISSMSATVASSVKQCFSTLVDGETFVKSHRCSKMRPRIKHTHHSRDVIIYAPFGNSLWIFDIMSLANSLLIVQWSK